MAHFVYDGTALPFPKTNLKPIPGGADSSKYVRGVDWNELNQAVEDLRNAIKSGHYFGLEEQSADPAPSGVDDYLWLKDTGEFYLHLGGVGGTDTQLNGGGSGGGDTVKVSPNDTTPGELIAKLAAGNRIILTEVNDGSNESFQIAVDDTDLDPLTGAPQGTVWYADSGGNITRLSPGTNGELLSTGGPSGDPSWTDDIKVAAKSGIETVYVRPGGSDATGDGSSGNPYATPLHAIHQLPRFLGNKRYLIDVTGVTWDFTGQEGHLPQFLGSDQQKITTEFGAWDPSAQIIFWSDLTVVDTISSHTETADPYTQTLTLTDGTKAWTVDEHKGRMVRDSTGFVFGAIASNTATELEVCAYNSFTAPIEIVEPGATFRRNEPGEWEGAVVLPENGPSYAFRGIKILHANTTDAYAYALLGLHGSIGAAAYCEINGVAAYGGGNDILFDSCYIHGESGSRKEFYMGGGKLKMRWSYAEHLEMRQYGDGGTGDAGHGTVIFDDCTSVLHGGNAEPDMIGELVHCKIRNGPGHGVVFYGGGKSKLSKCRIDNCAGDGVHVRAGLFTFLDNIGGSGNSGYGVSVEQAGVLEISDHSNIDITGSSGDLYVEGSYGAQSWPDYDKIYSAHQPPKRRYSYGSQRTIYVRTGSGDDNNTGESVGQAFATWERALEELQYDAVGLEQIIDITDCTISDANPFTFPPVRSGVYFDLDIGATAPDNFFVRAPVRVQASPTLVQSITINNVTADSESGIVTLDVAEALSAGAHVGQMVIGDNLAQYGRVVSNTTNQIVVSTTNTTWTAPVGIYTESCTMTFGDGSSFYTRAAYLQALGEWSFMGIAFRATGDWINTALEVWAIHHVVFQMCDIRGIQLHGGGGADDVYLDACYIHDGGWAINGANILVRHCLLKNLTTHEHGGTIGMFSCFMDGCEPFGDGAFINETLYDIGDSEIANGSSYGVYLRGFGNHRFVNLKIRDCAGDALYIAHPTFALLDGVHGSGNTGHGLTLRRGAHVRIQSGTDVTGSSGDVDLGAAGTVAWVDAHSDARYPDAEFVRVDGGGSESTIDFGAASGTSIKSGTSLTSSGNSVNTDASLGNTFEVDLNENSTLENPTNLVQGFLYTWYIKQGAGGPYTLDFGNVFKWTGGVAPSVTPVVGAIDKIQAYYDGSNLIASYSKDFRVVGSGTRDVINVRDYGARADGVTDDTAAFTAALAAVPDASSPWSDSRTVPMATIFVPNTEDFYYLASEVTIPTTKNVRIVGEGSNGSRIQCDADYAFFRDAPNGSFRAVGFENLMLDTCGVRIDDQSRNQHSFISCFFKNTPDYAIKLQSAGEVLDASGGVVGGTIFGCEFEDCNGAIVCQGDQSDNWLVERCQFTRSQQADIKLYSAGWRIIHNAFEQHYALSEPEASTDEPYINIDGDSVGDILVFGNRFGNEVGTTPDREPPRESIVVGPLGSSSASQIFDIKILSNFFRGRASGGPDADSANSAIRFNRVPSLCRVEGNYYFPYNSQLIEFSHGGNYDGYGNVFEINGEAVSVNGLTNHPPYFNQRPSIGDLGSWDWRGFDLEDPGVDDLIGDADDIDGSGSWTKTNVTITKDVTSYRGIANTAYTASKPSTGSASLTRALLSLDGRPVVVSARFRKVSGSSITTARFYIQNTTTSHFSASTSQTFTLKDYWERRWFVVFPSAGDSCIVAIGFGDVGETDTGDVEFDDVRVEYGTVPSSGPPKPHFLEAAGSRRQTLSSSSNSIDTDASLSNMFDVTLDENTTLENPTNLVPGFFYTWRIEQGAGGPYTLGFGSMFHFKGGEEMVVTPTVGAVDVISALYDGTALLTDFFQDVKAP